MKFYAFRNIILRSQTERAPGSHTQKKIMKSPWIESSVAFNMYIGTYARSLLKMTHNLDNHCCDKITVTF